jgi:lincosamide and streptogramin A transport system ATP-binding/permease protein
MSQIKVSGLTFSYDGSVETIFDHVSFSLDTDWKLGFVGRNGRGKTTFLKLLMGEYPFQGSISSCVEYDYFPFGVSDDAADTLSVLTSVSGGAEEWRLMRELSLLCVGEDTLSRPFHTLSSGERTKSLLAALFVKEDRFLLIDEPTNHLDVEGRAVVADYLSHKRGFLLVSHDRRF